MKKADETQPIFNMNVTEDEYSLYKLTNNDIFINDMNSKQTLEQFEPTNIEMNIVNQTPIDDQKPLEFIELTNTHNSPTKFVSNNISHHIS